jgi:hypothetical protein
VTIDEDIKWTTIAEDAAKNEGFTVIKSIIVGSSYIADSTEGDVDVLVLVKKEPGKYLGEWAFDPESGWLYGGSDPGPEADSHWGSWKKFTCGREVNLLLTDSKEWYDSFMQAAEVCKFIHLVQQKFGLVPEKTLRYGIHNILMDETDASWEAKSL